MVFQSLFLVPFTSVAVRYMVNYDPISTDDEHGSTNNAPSDIESPSPSTAAPPRRASGFWRFCAIGGAIYQVEGIGGFFKGLVPSFITTSIIPFILRVLLSGVLPVHSPFLLYMSPTPLYIELTARTVVPSMLLYVPSLIITYRAILTPHRLPWFSIKGSLRLLLTQAERKKPWLLWMTPGLVFAQLIHLSIIFFAVPFITGLIFQRGEADKINLQLLWRIPAMVLTIVLATGLLAPLQVMVTRLAVQRNYGAPGVTEIIVVSPEEETDQHQVLPVDAPKPTDNDATDCPSDKEVDIKLPVPTSVDEPVVAESEDNKHSSKEGSISIEIIVTPPQDAEPDIPPRVQPSTQNTSNEFIIRLRPENDPYRDLYDCFQKIRKEEGLGALYRLWWITLFFVYMVASL